jgi:hypothetical protein
LDGLVSFLAMIKPRYAILLDGGFVTRKFKEKLGRQPHADDVVAMCDEIRGNEHLADYELMRIYYYYDAPPSKETVILPVTGADQELAVTECARHAQSLYDQLELTDRFALRMGETQLSPFVWKLKPKKGEATDKTA